MSMEAHETLPDTYSNGLWEAFNKKWAHNFHTIFLASPWM